MTEMAANQAADIANIMAGLSEDEEEDEPPVVLTAAEKKAAKKNSQKERKQAVEKKREDNEEARKLKREKDRKARGQTLPPQRVSYAFHRYSPADNAQASSRRANTNAAQAQPENTKTTKRAARNDDGAERKKLKRHRTEGKEKAIERVPRVSFLFRVSERANYPNRGYIIFKARMPPSKHANQHQMLLLQTMQVIAAQYTTCADYFL